MKTLTLTNTDLFILNNGVEFTTPNSILPRDLGKVVNSWLKSQLGENQFGGITWTYDVQGTILFTSIEVNKISDDKESYELDTGWLECDALQLIRNKRVVGGKLHL